MIILQSSLFYIFSTMNRINLWPIFDKLWITEATTPEEIEAIAARLEAGDNEFANIPDSMWTPVSEEVAKAAEKFNAWEDEEDETEKTDEESSASTEEPTED